MPRKYDDACIIDMVNDLKYRHGRTNLPVTVKRYNDKRIRQLELELLDALSEKHFDQDPNRLPESVDESVDVQA